MSHPPQIPLTPQTNEANFPKWSAKALPGHSGYPYPRMLIRTFTEADATAWLKKNRKIDTATRQEYYDERIPEIGAIVPIPATAKLVMMGLADVVGEAVIVKDLEDERKACAELGIPLQSGDATIHQPKAVDVPLQPSAREAELIAENERLKAEAAKVAAKPPSPRDGIGKGRGWSEKRRAAQTARRLTPEEFAKE